MSLRTIETFLRLEVQGAEEGLHGVAALRREFELLTRSARELQAMGFKGGKTWQDAGRATADRLRNENLELKNNSAAINVNIQAWRARAAESNADAAASRAKLAALRLETEELRKQERQARQNTAAEKARRLEILQGLSTMRNAARDFSFIFGKMATDASLAFGIITGGVVGMSRALVTARSDFQQIQVTMTSFLGDAQKANALLKDLQTYALTSPKTYKETINAAKMLIGYGFPTDALRGRQGDIMDTLTKRSYQLGIPLEQISAELYRLAVGNVRKREAVASGFYPRIFGAAGVPMDGSAIKDLGLKPSEVAARLLTQLQKEVQGIEFKNIFGVFVSNIADAWDFALRQLSDDKHLGPAMDRIAQGVMKGMQRIGQILTDPKVTAAFTKFVDSQLIPAIDALVDRFGAFLEMVARDPDSIPRFLHNIGETIKWLVSVIVTANAVSVISTFTQVIIDMIKLALTPTIPVWGKVGLGAVIVGLIASVPMLKGKIEELLEPLGMLPEGFDSAGQAADSATGGFDNLTGSADRLKTALQLIREEHEEHPDFWDKWKSGASVIGSNLGSMWDNIKAGASGFVLTPKGTAFSSGFAVAPPANIGKEALATWKLGVLSLQNNGLPSGVTEDEWRAMSSDERYRLIVNTGRQAINQRQKTSGFIGPRQPGKATWENLLAWTEAQGFRHTNTKSPMGWATGGVHNKGSLHYQGRAIDVSVTGKSDAEIKAFIAAAKAAGIRVVDERRRPKGQKVWGGAHLHLEAAADWDGSAEFALNASDLTGLDVGDETGPREKSDLDKALERLAAVKSEHIRQATLPRDATQQKKWDDAYTEALAASYIDIVNAGGDPNDPRWDAAHQAYLRLNGPGADQRIIRESVLAKFAELKKQREQELKLALPFERADIQKRFGQQGTSLYAEFIAAGGNPADAPEMKALYDRSQFDKQAEYGRGLLEKASKAAIRHLDDMKRAQEKIVNGVKSLVDGLETQNNRLTSLRDRVVGSIENLRSAWENLLAGGGDRPQVTATRLYQEAREAHARGMEAGRRGDMEAQAKYYSEEADKLTELANFGAGLDKKYRGLQNQIRERLQAVVPGALSRGESIQERLEHTIADNTEHIKLLNLQMADLTSSIERLTTRLDWLRNPRSLGSVGSNASRVRSGRGRAGAGGKSTSRVGGLAAGSKGQVLKTASG